MSKVSVIIPSCIEPFLDKTIDDIFAKARGEIEVVVTLDGYKPDPPLRERKNLVLVYREQPLGMRQAINSAVAASTGMYLMKSDAHCMYEEGFDETLKAECENNWIVIPRRYSLDPEMWTIKRTGRAPVDYHYMPYPFDVVTGGLNPNINRGGVWKEKAKERLDILLDDEMVSQGSCWFMYRKYFIDFLGGLSEEEYGKFGQEFYEIGNKTWLSGGRVVINKKTWYAHLHKGRAYNRGFFLSGRTRERTTRYSWDYWMHDRWKGRIHDFEWLIDKFWPVPTWPEDWKEKWKTYPSLMEPLVRG